MSDGKLRVGVVGAGRWAVRSHIPGWQRDPRVEVVALADTDAAALAEAGEKFGVKKLASDYRDLVTDPDIDVIDVVTGDRAHFEVSMAALENGKHVLCEKPVHADYRQVVAAADLAAAKGLKTKLGFTFRYAPATLYAAELIEQGFIGEPYMLNAFEQNSQWLDPQTPLRQLRDGQDPDEIAVASIEGYGAPVIDIMHWWMDAPLQSVVGTMRNFVPNRVVRETGEMTRVNIDDGDMWIAEFGSG
ncbi:MAG: Gfo/Idh/MocA family oxidoreductase, partial [Actinoplanes sp.]